MIGKYAVRHFHSGVQLWTAPKSALAALRKKTGYTFANCKKALDMHNNDLQKAESWLKEQAQSLGWSKATKLQGRQTTQGLIGVLIKDNVGAMVEINCETDFVARNEHFQGMLDKAANACIQYAKDAESAVPLTKINLNTDQLKDLKSSDGKSLADHLALMIGTVGENASLKRALCYKVNNTILLSGYAHPSGGDKSDTLLGRFAALVALKQQQQVETEENVEELGKKLCQHVVGMDPKIIGTDNDEPSKNTEDETCLIHQEYLHDDSFSVKEVLQEYGLEVVDFKRFGCGENEEQGTKLEQLETCQ